MNGKQPRHIAVIMDGNRRWAKQHGVAAADGHRRGAAAVRRTVEHARRLGIDALTLYAFSADNWRRSPREVRALMALLEQYARDEEARLIENGIRVKVLGEIERLPPTTRRALEELTETTSRGRDMALNLAISYGGRREIVRAVNSLLDRRDDVVPPVTEKLLGGALYTAGQPDPDLLIRTGGDMRLSDFLLWQAAYAELFFTPCLWPDFDEGELDRAIAEFRSRQRRFGR